MTPPPFSIVGFDLDGTLLDTSGDLAVAVNYALASDRRAPLSVEQIKPMIGGGARHMLRQGMAATGGWDEATLDRLQALLLESYERNIAVLTKPYPGMIDALNALTERGVTLAVVTNKRERFAATLLSELKLIDRFTCVIGGDTLGPDQAKPSPAPIYEMMKRCGGASACFVGDSIYDVEAAHSAGLPVIACSFGFLTMPVEQLGADAIIDNYGELITTLAQLKRTHSPRVSNAPRI